MYKIGTKFKASVEYEIIEDNSNDYYKVKWLNADIYKIGFQYKKSLYSFIDSGQWKITYIPKDKCNLCRNIKC